MSKADFEKWEGRYGAAEHRGPDAPEPFVVDAIAPLSPGRAVDIAGGLGRHVLWLAQRGWQTTIIDISPRAVSRVCASVEDMAGSVTGHAVDLDDPEAAQTALPAAAFDVVLCTWFLPSEHIWTRMSEALRPGGRLIYVQPTAKNQRRHAHPSARFLWPDDTLPYHLEELGLRVQRYEEGWDARDHHTARAVAIRPPM